MNGNGNYPAGAENDPHAPYNEPDCVGVVIDLTATATFQRTESVYCKDAYLEEERDEDGAHEILNTECCDFDDDFVAEHLTIPQIFEEVTAILNDLAKREPGRADRYQHLISEMAQWEEVDFDVEA